MPLAKALVPALVIACLAGCGGGGGEQTDPPPTGSPPPPTTPPPPPTSPTTSGLDTRPINTSCLATTQPTFGIPVTTKRVFPKLSFTAPVLLLQPPGDTSKWYVVEKSGVVKSFANNNDTSSVTTVIDLSARVVSEFYEAGLLGMAFDPSYASNGRVYLSYTAAPTVSGQRLESRISRFSASGGVLNPASESILLKIAQPYATHNGGHIAFGPDGMLYAGFGDGGAVGDPNNFAQNRSRLLGKMIRIDVSGSSGYTVPSDNPFVGPGSVRCENGSTSAGMICSEIYAYGFRNPWRWSFDKGSETPDVWAGDVGQSDWEEIDHVVSGGNYGWRIREATHCYNPATDCPVTADGVPLIDPVNEYSHTVGAAVTGGYVYRGNAIPSLAGRYVFGDFITGMIYVLMPKGDGTLERKELVASGAQISSFAEGHDGEIYVVDYAGRLLELVPGGAVSNPIKTSLSQTGCVDPGDPAKPASGLIPYEPVAPFWSDGASKSRWMALPENTTISIEADGDWTFPNGSVLMKQFELDGQLIETRLFMRHTDTGNWRGYTYRWNSSQTDAVLVTGGRSVTIGTHRWIYPSEGQCMQCHTTAAGDTLGLETRQLNSDIAYPVTGRTANQLTTLEKIGMFSGTLKRLDAYPNPSDTTQSLAVRARSYLHTNCAQCHRPGGGAPSEMDLRYSTPLADTNICGVTPSTGDLGVTGAKIVSPADASHSVLYLRMTRRDGNKMPPVGSNLVDAEAGELIQRWIDGMGSGCE
jgi:uncharacterized repeat protein (TIGR03806 family)